MTGQSSSGISGLFQASGAANASTTLIAKAFTTQTGDLIQAQNSAGVSLFKVDVNGNVGVGTIAPSSPLSVTPLQYNTGTASQSLTTVTGTGTVWTSAMVGSQFVFASGVSAGTITAVGSATSLTVTASQTVASQAYSIAHTGLQVAASGNVGIGTTSPSGKLDVQGGTAVASTNGVGINLVAQSAGSGGNFNGGSVNLTSGNSTNNGTGGNIVLSGPIMPSQNSGGNIQIKSGAYANAMGASYLELAAGGAAVGNGDALLRAGDGHVLLGTPGSLNLRAGNAFYDAGGTVNITAGNGGSSNGTGGDVVINGGSKQGSGTFGNVVLANAGGNVGIGATTPGTSSILDINSTSKGVVLPRMTKAQRDLIASPVAGMAVYQIDNTSGLRVYNGTNWMRFTETAD